MSLNPMTSPTLSLAKSRRSGPAVATALLIAIAGCGGGDEEKSAPTAGGSRAGSGTTTIEIGGSSTVFRISNVAREEYESSNENVHVIVKSNGTGPGFAQYLKNELDIVGASRPAKPEEEEKSKEQGLDWTRFLIGYDGIAVVVNRKNTFVKELSVADLKRVFEPDSKVNTWKDLNPAWPDKKIIIYTPDKESGTFEYFTEAINGKPRAQRKDVQPSTDDNILVTGVKGDEFGLGYFGYAYYAANAGELRAVPIKAKDDATAIEPTPETILKKTYTPLARPLYIYVKNKSLRRPEVAAFVKFYLENAPELAKRAKYVAPTAEDQAENLKLLAGNAGPKG
jgi:phosphate transport system substrate-binding protein